MACFVLLAQPRRRDRADDTLAMFGAVELRVAEPGRDAHGERAAAGDHRTGAASATLVLSDVQVSRMHARIDVWDGELGVRDLGSRNGTWLNARPIDEPEPLAAGDQLELGETRIEVRGVGPVRPRRAERNSRTHRKLSP